VIGPVIIETEEIVESAGLKVWLMKKNAHGGV
jgi:hypothetical protein